MNQPLLLAIVGPTASGKSDLGLALAERFDGEIVNCDSMQLYRGLDVGTGKVPPEDRRGISHHLLDVADPRSFCSAGEYARQARLVLEEIRARRRLPIVVGGTGLYLRALLYGLFEGPARSPELRARLNRIIRRGGLPRLHRRLARIDPVSARRIAPKDAPRILRALEVYLLTGEPLSAHFVQGSEPLPGFRIAKIGLNPVRAELYPRIHSRIDAMLSKGWIEEVRRMLAAGVPPDGQAFSALGYRRIVAHLAGEINEDELLERIKTDTRHYAKRQWTWFRKEADVHWLDGFGDDPKIQTQAADWVADRL